MKERAFGVIIVIAICLIIEYAPPSVAKAMIVLALLGIHGAVCRVDETLKKILEEGRR